MVLFIVFLLFKVSFSLFLVYSQLNLICATLFTREERSGSFSMTQIDVGLVVLLLLG